MLRSVALIFALAISLLAATPATAQKSLDSWHVNKEYGFKLRPLSKWAQIPLQPDEKIAITKFNGPQLEMSLKEGQISCPTELLILRFTPKAVGVTTGAQPAKPPSPEDEEKPEEISQDLDAWAKEESGWQNVRKEGETKDTKYGKVPVRETVFLRKTRFDFEYKTFAVEFSEPGETLVLVYDMAEPHFGKWESLIRQSAKTFTRIAKTEAVGQVQGDGIDSQRQRHATDVKRVAGWTLEETDRYFIKIHNSDRDFVEQVKEHIELIRTRLEEDFPPTRPITVKSVLRVCKDRTEYNHYGGPGGSAGYWNSSTEELVIYDDKETQRSDSFRTMYHEAFHQYIFYRCGEISPHSWYNEGTGDYYAGATLKYGKLEIRPFQWRTETIRSAIHAKRWVPFEKILHYSQADYYGKEIGLCYAQGWSMVYFLREGKKEGAKTWEKEWERILPTYLDVLTETKDKEKAIKAAFQGIDVLALEEAWAHFTKGV